MLNKHVILTMLLALWLSASQASTPPQLPFVYVVTESLPPFQYLSDDRRVVGTSTLKVMHWLKSANIDHQLEILPWARAYKRALDEPNTLIYSLVRTEQREKLFLWVAPVADIKLYFVTKHGRLPAVTSLEKARRYRIGVKRHDIVSDYLLSQGFSFDVNLVEVTDTEQTFVMLLNERVDLIPFSPLLVAPLCARLGCQLNDFNIAFEVPELRQNMFLAASLGTSAQVINALRLASQTPVQ